MSPSPFTPRRRKSIGIGVFTGVATGPSKAGGFSQGTRETIARPHLNRYRAIQNKVRLRGQHGMYDKWLVRRSEVDAVEGSMDGLPKGLSEARKRIAGLEGSLAESTAAQARRGPRCRGGVEEHT